MSVTTLSVGAALSKALRKPVKNGRAISTNDVVRYPFLYGTVTFFKVDIPPPPGAPGKMKKVKGDDVGNR